VRDHPDEIALQLIELTLTGERPLELELRSDLARQRAQRRASVVVELPWKLVDHAESPESDTFVDLERRPRVEADQPGAYGGKGRESGIRFRVGHHEQLAVRDAVVAEALVTAGHLRLLDAEPRLEEQAVPVHEADERDRRVAELGGEPDELVEVFLRRAVENAVIVENGEPSLLDERIDCFGSCLHAFHRGPPRSTTAPRFLSARAADS
jgi:hypothetical protein